MKWNAPVVVTAAVALAVALSLFYFRYLRPDPAVLPALAGVVDDYRNIIVLMEGSEALDDATRARSEAAGQVLFWHKRRSLDEIAAKFADPSGRRGRILHELNEQQKGVILLHDSHQQSVRALSPIIEELIRQNYTFLEFDKGQFVKSSPPLITDRAAATPAPVSPVSDAPRKLYRESWAVIIRSKSPPSRKSCYRCSKAFRRKALSWPALR